MLTLFLLLALGGSDETAKIQRMIDRCTPGGTVILPAGSHSVSTLQMKPHCSYSGAAAGTTLVLLTKNAFLMDVSGRSDIKISGITFDANGLGGALLAQGTAPVRGIQVLNNRFQNVVAASVYPANL